LIEGAAAAAAAAAKEKGHHRQIQRLLQMLQSSHDNCLVTAEY
jgi:hypothetical protein